MMRSIGKYLHSKAGQSLVEMTFGIPMLIALGFGVVEMGNMIHSYLVLSHLSREAANVVSRETGIKGSPQWAASINADLDRVIDKAAPVINATASGPRGPSQYKIYYSMVEWNNSSGVPCPGADLANGQPDHYRIRRSNTNWAGNVTWEYGTLNQSSSVGSDGDCAYLKLPEVKNLSTQGLELHVVEVFFNYAPSKLTPVEAFIGALTPGIFYRRTVFMDVVG